MQPTGTPAPPQMTACPRCGSPAEITRRTVLESTDGPIEHAAVRCVEAHVHLLPVETLERAARRAHTRPARRVPGGPGGPASTHVERR